MATNDELRGIKPFDCRGDECGAKSFQFYVDGRGITAAARRKALPLHCAEMEVKEIFETLRIRVHLKGKTTTYTRLHFEHSMHSLHHK